MRQTPGVKGEKKGKVEYNTITPEPPFSKTVPAASEGHH